MTAGLAALMADFLVGGAILADAWTTRKLLLDWKIEGNPLREWLIDKLGLDVGTFGVAGLAAGSVVWMNWVNDLSPTTILVNLTALLFYGYATYQNLGKL